MSLEVTDKSITNIGLMKKFTLFNEKIAIDDGVIVKCNEVASLFADKDETYRNMFSIMIQRTKYISNIDKQAFFDLCSYPIGLHEVVSVCNNSNDCFSLVLLKNGDVVGFCCFMLSKTYTYIRYFGTSTEVCCESVYFSFCSIIKDLVMKQSNEVKPFIMINIQCKQTIIENNHGILKIFDDKCPTLLSPNDFPLLDKQQKKFFVTDKKMLEGEEITDNYEIVNLMSATFTLMSKKIEVTNNKKKLSSRKNIVPECVNSVQLKSKLPLKKLHTHVLQFENQKRSWTELPKITDNNLKIDTYPYKQYCCEPNHFNCKNEMVSPKVPNQICSTTTAAEYLKFIQNDIGSDFIIAVIDVIKETELLWPYKKLITYFEDQNKNRLYNQVSLETSFLPINNKIVRPKFVEEIDWITNVMMDKMDLFPRIQRYIITSVEGCYMDYHVDLSGTSVWYHVVIRIKEICLIKPTNDNLKIYEKWLCPFNVSKIFLPELITDKSTIYYVRLLPNETLIIPSGYIHAVYTAKDSIVFGGNFLHSNDVKMQFDIYAMEGRKSISNEQRIPYFVEINLHMCYYVITQKKPKVSFEYDRNVLLIIIKECKKFISGGYKSLQLEMSVSYLLKQFGVTKLDTFFTAVLNFCEEELPHKKNAF
jgi:hypothetical protein